MCRCKEQVFYKILLPCLHPDNPSAAAVLALIGIQRGTLYIIQIRQRKYAGFLLNQILHINFARILHQLCAAFIGIFLLNRRNFILDYAKQQLFIRQNGLVIRNLLLQLCIFRIDFFLFQALQTAQLHFQNRLCLQIRQAEAFHQSLLCIIIACADNSDYLVNVVNRNPQTLQNMRSFFRLIQIKACSSGNNIFLMLQVFRKHLLQI